MVIRFKTVTAAKQLEICLEPSREAWNAGIDFEDIHTEMVFKALKLDETTWV